ncbi:divergent PAP2 family protein [Undibacterium flavidum]|uniref:Divergent PAP2 family protein n=1 Tax=Undibacterium flavidum TaxID=2762297 RepID=A0ABR6Y962_9BURK|nr:divergent PAP2 family protein [Undibacterium flavidum]MBC3873151.1 divergent PAP2 family protein [Undibacterium flavidum]
MKFLYLMTPPICWLVGGGLKFVINSFKARQLAFHKIGYGGFPSNHSCIVSGTATIIAIQEGVSSAVFCVSLCVAIIVIIDAHGLRNEIGKHATIINQLTTQKQTVLREKVGHSNFEIIGGIVTGVVTSSLLFYLMSFL